MNLQWVKTFLTVLETGNYSNAAEVLGYAQSTVTGQMQTLENYLGGVRLLTRSGNRMVPTIAGEAFLPYARELTRTCEKAIQAVAVSQENALRIGTINLLSESTLPCALQVIRESVPGVSLTITTGRPQELYTQLSARSLDMIFIIDHRQKHTGFSTRTVREEPLSVVMSKDHPFARRRLLHGALSDAPVAFSDIKKEALILTDEGCNFRRFLLEEYKRHDCEPQITMESPSLPVILDAVRNGWGIGFLPAFLVPPSEDLVPIPLQSAQTPLSSQIIYRQSDLCTHALIRKIAERLRHAQNAES